MFEIHICYFRNYMTLGSKIGLGTFFKVRFKTFNCVFVSRCGN